MKKIIADYKLIGNEIKKIEGKFAKESDYDTVIDYDCKVYSKTVCKFICSNINMR